MFILICIPLFQSSNPVFPLRLNVALPRLFSLTNFTGYKVNVCDLIHVCNWTIWLHNIFELPFLTLFGVFTSLRRQQKNVLYMLEVLCMSLNKVASKYLFFVFPPFYIVKRHELMI